MDQNIESKLEIKDRILNFYNSNKRKVIFLAVTLVIFLILGVFLNYKNEKKNILIAEKYVQAGLLLSSKDNNGAKILFEEIILSKNKFYSILALNTLIEKKLINDKSKIINYFEMLETNISSESEKDLIIFKKALYLLKNSDEQKGNELLNDLINRDSTLKNIAQDLLIK